MMMTIRFIHWLRSLWVKISNQAQRAYKKLLAKYPDEDQLRTSLADIAIDEDDTDQALMYLSEISEDSTAYIESLLVAEFVSVRRAGRSCEGKLLAAYQQDSEEPIIHLHLQNFICHCKISSGHPILSTTN